MYMDKGRFEMTRFEDNLKNLIAEILALKMMSLWTTITCKKDTLRDAITEIPCYIVQQLSHRLSIRKSAAYDHIITSFKRSSFTDDEGRSP